MLLSAYIPEDRYAALVQDRELPEETSGAALYADISGFTALTDKLVRQLGVKSGLEELTGYLNKVYDAIIAPVHNYGGSVIGFSGDAITCWFDGDDKLAAQRAVATAQQFSERLKK